MQTTTMLRRPAVAASLRRLRAASAPRAPRPAAAASSSAAAAPAAPDAPAAKQQPQKPPGKQQQQKKQQQQQGKQQQQQQQQQRSEESVTPKSEDFSRWYLDVVAKAQLADYGPVRGTMVIRPYGFALWENVQRWLDAELKSRGVDNAYFPQLIPLSFIAKEAQHVEGFAPELALVTKGGGKDLEEPLAVRPTSETIVNHMMAQWVQSYRDLPMRLNQWCNVHRWEMRTRPFIRTLEFLWQEGHTAHATAAEARLEAMDMVRLYERFAVEAAAIPVVAGRKSRAESFAGADATFTIEAMMGDGKALQAGTSHDLGTNFSRAFGTQFTDEAGALVPVHQSSWGVSTRLVGGIIMAHGDDKGLRLPPVLAPTQVVIVPIYGKGGSPESDEAGVGAAARALLGALRDAGVRAKVDDNEAKTPGWRYNYWELKGVPLRVEVGPRDVAAGTVVTAARDAPGKEGKVAGAPGAGDPPAFVAHVRSELDALQARMLADATAFRDANIVDVASYDELKAAVAEGKWARGPWSGSDADEARVKEETGATLRCFPFAQPASARGSACFMTGSGADEVAIFAKSY
jgi:prolyl-tRNA synthetase